MTIKQLYNWAEEQGISDYELFVLANYSDFGSIESYDIDIYKHLREVVANI